MISSGRQDSNLRPPAPKAGAITGLRYAPNKDPSLELEKKLFRESFKYTYKHPLFKEPTFITPIIIGVMKKYSILFTEH
jgi:hypothetical protein